MTKNERPPDDAPHIAIHTAVMFDCEVCGQENFVRCVSHVMTREETTRIMRSTGQIESYEEAPDAVAGIGKVTPMFVRCRCCGTWFRSLPIASFPNLGAG